MPDLEHEEAETLALLARPGLTVFVGRRQRVSSSDVMAGRKSDIPWFRAVHCVGADHLDRAAAIVERYRNK